MLSKPYPWQQPIWERSDTLAPVSLFAGQAGIGKYHLLCALAFRAMCEESHGPCLQCRHCRLNMAGTHPDFFKVIPEEPGKMIKIDAIRELISFAEKTPQLSDKKVIVLGPVESLTVNAANALLKTLEEPSASTYILLYTHSISQVMATIRSRCQLQLLPAPTMEQGAQWLKAHYDEGVVKQAILLAPQSPLTVQQYIEDDWCQVIEVLTVALNPGSNKTVLDVGRTLMEHDLATIVDLWITLTQIWLKRYIHSESLSMPSLSGVDRWPKPISDAAFDFYDQLLSHKKQLISGANPNKQLLLEDLLIAWRVCY
ncbi:hypothetical protein N9J26_00830 [bacterium]|nr:hypothetical protein [bacterium]